MLAYLLAVRPYVAWQVQGLELGAHSLELLILVLAVSVIQGGPNGSVSWAMTGAQRVGANGV